MDAQEQQDSPRKAEAEREEEEDEKEEEGEKEAAGAGGSGSSGGGVDPIPSSEVDRRAKLLMEAELDLRCMQLEMTRQQVMEEAQRAAEAERLLAGERRRGDVMRAACARYQEGMAEAHARLDATTAQMDDLTRSLHLLEEENANLKQQIHKQGEHLSCQLELENAAIKYQAKIKQYLLLLANNMKQLDNEQQALKQSVTKVSEFTHGVQKGVKHFSCKEELWLKEKQDLETKVIQQGAELKKMRFESVKAQAEKCKYYEGVFLDLRENLKLEIENNAKLSRTIENIRSSETNNERKIEELTHQLYQKKEQIEALESEKETLNKQLKHSERQIEIMERKHKCELEYAHQKPLAFSCETQTDPTEEDSKAQECALSYDTRMNRQYCRGRLDPVYEGNTSDEYADENMSTHSAPSYNHQISYRKFVVPYYTIHGPQETNRNTDPISLDSFGPPFDDDFDWFSRREPKTDEAQIPKYYEVSAKTQSQMIGQSAVNDLENQQSQSMNVQTAASYRNQTVKASSADCHAVSNCQSDANYSGASKPFDVPTKQANQMNSDPTNLSSSQISEPEEENPCPTEIFRVSSPYKTNPNDEISKSPNFEDQQYAADNLSPKTNVSFTDQTTNEKPNICKPENCIPENPITVIKKLSNNNTVNDFSMELSVRRIKAPSRRLPMLSAPDEETVPSSSTDNADSEPQRKVAKETLEEEMQMEQKVEDTALSGNKGKNIKYTRLSTDKAVSLSADTVKKDKPTLKRRSLFLKH